MRVVCESRATEDKCVPPPSGHRNPAAYHQTAVTHDSAHRAEARPALSCGLLSLCGILQKLRLHLKDSMRPCTA